MLSQIHDKRDQLHKKQEEEKKEQLVNGRAFDVACSILNMSTSDLQEFLKDKDFDVSFVSSFDVRLLHGYLRCFLIDYVIQIFLSLFIQNGKQFEENNIRENLQIILQKEVRFPFLPQKLYE